LLHLCPTCRRRFDESGFCPFDGASLVAGTAADQRTLVADDARAAQQTQVSAAMPAQPAVVPVLPPDLHTLADAAELAREPATQLDVRRGTFPLTPKPGSVGTGEITSARGRPEPSPRRRPRPRSRRSRRRRTRATRSSSTARRARTSTTS